MTWSKANGPGPFHEGPLLDVFRDVQAPSALLPLDVDSERGWLLLDDGGPTLRTLLAPDGRDGDTDLGRWTRVLPRYAALQRHMERHVDAMLRAGVPDERPGRLPGILARLLETDDVWARVDEADRPEADAARARLWDLVPVVADLAEELAASAIPATIDHGDLHGNNIVIGDDGAPRIFDWGDAVVAHPFQTMTGTLGSIGHHAGVDPYGPDLDPVRDAYLEAWTVLAPRSSLVRMVPLAMDLGHIAKASAWDRALAGLTPDAMGGHHGATAAWLMDLVSRLERRPA